jgi:hypothetical protein
MYILVLIIFGHALAPIPVPFEYSEQCETAGKVWKAQSRDYGYYCVNTKPLQED